MNNPDPAAGRLENQKANTPQQAAPVAPARSRVWIQRSLTWLTAGYVLGLCVLLAALEWWGERNWLLSVLLYAPPQLLLIPLTVLSPLCLLFRWRLIFWHLAAAALLVFGYMTFRWSPAANANATAITAVSFNIGESNRAQFLAFLAREKPDLIILQDARNRGAGLAKLMPAMQTSELGEFVLLSRYPILSAGLVQGTKPGERALAARWELLIQSRAVAIYSVHLPTPRRELSQFVGKRNLLGGLVGWRRPAFFGEYREWIKERIDLARSLAKVLAKEEKPMIVGGDFNTPDHGYIYHLFAGVVSDAFATAGRGWGLTFPGNTPHWLALNEPWLRIDYFFVGRGWKAVECRPEPGRQSQHKAVVARFEQLARP